MKSLNFKNSSIRNLFYWMFMAAFLSGNAIVATGQVKVPFQQRTSSYTPDKKIYNIKGDFTMIGNTNLTLVTYGDNTANSNNIMKYVDIDSDNNTFNSSSANLTFSTENGATPTCSKIIYAGLYWTGRAHNSSPSSNEFTVAKLDPATSVSSPFTIANGGTIPNTTYSMVVSRNGNNNSYTVRYSFSSTGNTTYLFEFRNSSTYVRYSTNNGITWTNVSNESIANNGNIRTSTFDPVTIYTSADGGQVIKISSLIRDSRTNQTAAIYQSSAKAGGSVTATPIITKTLNKQKVSLKGPGESSYTTVTANANDLYYPTTTDGFMYSAYAEVTDYVKSHGIGDYFVADVAVNEGNGGSTGYYGGWSLIVVYENSKMKWRDVTIFDGHAYVYDEAGNDNMTYYELPVSGFNTVQQGAVNMKLGIVAGEGDRGISIDRLSIRNYSDNAWIDLNHSNNTTDNFFASAIYTGGNSRNPNLYNNTGLDIAMFNIPNANNTVITNNQTSTKFRYGTNQDTYIISCIAMAVDAYIPEPEMISMVTSINGIVPSSPLVVEPGQEIEYKVELRNKGTEAINNAKIIIPIPYTASYVSGSATVHYTPLPTPNNFYYDPSLGATGSMVWDLGSLPLPANSSTLLGTLTFKLKVTEDCSILINNNCPPVVSLNGKASGQGATTGTLFDNIGMIQGYSNDGNCQGEPINEPVNVDINAANFVLANCQGVPQVRSFTYCNVGSSIPITQVSSSFPPGSRFYSEYPLEGSYTEYTINNPFPATSGTKTYYAIPPGATECHFEFTITVTNITSMPSVGDIDYCIGETASPLTASPSNSSYILYYYTTPTGGTPQTSITPLTTTAGITNYYVAEGVSGQCISPNRASIKVTVNASPTCSITGLNPVTYGSSNIYSAPDGMTSYIWTVTGDGSIIGSTNAKDITVNAIAAGTYTLNLEMTNSSGCKSFCSQTVTVNKAPLTITAGNQTKTYGDTFTFTGSEFTASGLVNGNTVTGVTLTSAGAAATAATGTYDIIASAATGTGLGNYTITYVNGTLTVEKKALTITAGNQTKTYGDTFTFTGSEFTASGLVNGNTVTGVTLTSAGAAATAATGTYDIIASAATGTGLGNYTITYVNGTLTVEKKALTITAGNQTKTYGDTFTFTGSEFTASGLVNGNTVTGVTLTSAGAAATAATGTYDIIASAATGTGLGNYTITYVNGTLTVEKKALTITAGNQTKTYGDTFIFTGSEFTTTGLVNGNTVTGVTLTSTGAAATAATGTYDIIASAATGTGLGNYTITYVNGTLTVEKKALTITAGNQTKTYGDTFTFTRSEFTASGLVNGNTVTGVTLTSAGAAATAATGTYDIIASAATGTGLGNYTITYVNGTLTVEKKALTITAGNQTKTYGDTFIFTGSEFTTTGLVNGNTVTGVTLTSTGAAATAATGTYDIIASAATGTGLGNYTITYVNGTLTVEKKALTITAGNQTKTYGDTFTFTGSEFMASGLVNGNTVTGVTLTSAGAAATAATGTYDIIASAATGTGLANYTITYVNGTLTVEKKALTITAGNQTKTYGDTFTFTGSEFTASGLVNGNTVTGVTLTSAGAAATAATGTYDIIASAATGTGLGNYTITYVNGTLTVEKKALTITAGNQTKTYGDTFTFTGSEFTASGLVNGNTVTGVTLTSAGAAATAATGTYDIIASAATGTGLGNYTITYVNGTLTVEKKALTITAQSSVKPYGNELIYSGTEFTVTGLQGSDVVNNVTITSSGATATAAVGTYTVNVSSATGTGLENYSISYVNGTLTVEKKALIITANNLVKTYGATLTFAGNEFTTSGLKNGDTVTGVLLTSPGAVATAAIGNYDISISGATGSGLDNYEITYVEGLLIVGNKILIITANSSTKTYGQEVVFAGTEFTVSGLEDNDTVDKVTLTSTGASETAAVGTHDIFASAATGTGLENYTITYAKGFLTIEKKLLEITANSNSKTYGQELTFAGSEFTVSGLEAGDAVNNVNLISNGAPATAGVGTYNITAGAASGSGLDNYSISYIPGNLDVNKKALTITANDQTKTYGETFNFTGNEFMANGLVNNDKVDLVTLVSNGATSSAAVGSYEINASEAVGTGLDNYDISYINGTLAVNNKILTITANNNSKIYGQELTFAGSEFTVSGLEGSDAVNSVDLTSTGLASTAEVGVYDILASGASGTGLSNYTINYIKGSLTIGKKELNVSANDQAKIYGDNFVFAGNEFTASGLVNGNTVTSVTLTSAGAITTATVGTYDIIVSAALGTGLDNYDITYNIGTLTVNKRTLNISADNQSKIYDGAIYSPFTASFNGFINGEDASILNGVLVFTGAATTAVNVGNYVIIPAGLTSDNYDITFVNGALDITSKTITVSATTENKIYGEVDPELSYTFLPVLADGDTFTGSLIREAGEAIGDYVINQGTLALSSNYTLVYIPANLTIAKRTVTITADSKSKIYSEPDPSFAFRITSGTLVYADSFTGSLTRESGENVGNYEIQQGSVVLNDNYALTYVPADLVIDKATLTVTADPKTKNRGAENPPLTYQYSGFVNGENESVLQKAPVASTYIDNTTVLGVYEDAITVSGGEDENYSFIYVAADFTVIDNENPVITCPASINVDTDAGLCSAAVTIVPATATDNDEVTVNGVRSDNKPLSDPYPVGVTTITWMATDASNNSVSCKQTVTVTDAQNPAATAPANVSVNVDANSCNATGVSLGTPETSDNCGIKSVNNDAPVTFPLGTTTVTWTIVDNNNNAVTVTQSVTVVDNINPTINCPVDVTVPTDAGKNTASGVTLGTPVTSDNCSVGSVTNDAPAIFPLGTTMVTWTVFDNSGNNATCTQIVTVTDKEEPKISCVAGSPFARNTDTGKNTYTIQGTEFDATFSDNVAGASISNDFNSNASLSGAILPLGSTTIVWTVTDAAGNKATCSTVVTVSDTEEPKISCVAGSPFARNTDTGKNTYTIQGTEFDATFSDNVAGASISNDFNSNASLSGAILPLGSTTIVWTVTDAAGNKATCSTVVTVSDTEEPKISCVAGSPFARNTDTGKNTYTIQGTEFDATFSDNVAGASISNDFNSNASLSGAILPLGSTTILWTVTDAAGNKATCSTVVTVSDTEEPKISCVAGSPFARNTDTGKDTYTVQGTEFDATFSDNVAGASISNDFNSSASLSGAILPLGSTTILWTVTDAAGNKATCSTVVTVSDTEEPKISCVAGSPFARNTDTGKDTYTVQGTEFDATFSDNVAGASISNDFNSSATLAGAILPLGSTTILWTVTDAAGNKATCSTVVTVSDTEEPKISCVAGSPFARNTDTGKDTYTVQGTEFDATFSDNVAGASISNDFNSSATLAGAILPLGSTTILWTVTDAAGNKATCSTVVTVSDTEEPKISCVAGSPFARNTDTGKNTYTIQGTEFDATFSDNVAGASISNDFNSNASLSGAILPLGSTTIVWTVTDAAGNKATCSTVVTVSDTEEPKISCVAGSPFARNTDTGKNTYTVQGTEFDATFSDNVAGSSISNDFNSSATLAGAILPLGSTTILWTVTDAAGNKATCSTVVTVSDTEEPKISCVAGSPFARNTDTGKNTYTIQGTEFDATFSDNVAGASISNDFNSNASLSGAILPLGSTTIVWTVTDAAGNKATCSTVVTVSDTEEPKISCVAGSPFARNTDTGKNTYTVQGTEFDATFSDNVAGASISNDFNSSASLSGAILPLGSTTILWTVTDAAGNKATCSTVVTVSDTEEPKISCVAGSPFARNTDTGKDTYTVQGTEFDATFSDNVAGASISNDFNSSATLAGAILPLGSTTILWTVTDAAGNKATCSTVVTVSDTEEPKIGCVAGSPFARNTDTGKDTYTVQGTEFDATFSDNVAGASISNDFNSSATLAGAILPLGSTTILWTVTDAAGNKATCSTVVTVSDTEEPKISCVAGSPFARNTDTGKDTYTVQGTEFDATFSDNVAGASISNDFNSSASLSGAILPLGSTTILWTVTDAAGNKATCSTVVTVSDTEEPKISCIAGSPFARNTDTGKDTYTVQGTEFDATFSDNVAGASISNDFNSSASLSGAILPLGSTTILWTVTDAAGNKATCSTIVTVTDMEKPIFTQCLNGSDQTVNSDNGVNNYTHSGTSWNAVATDNDGIKTLTYQLGGVTTGAGTTLNGVTFNKGVTIVTWTAVDNSGNNSICTFNVTVTDNEKPVFTKCMSGTNQSVNSNEGVSTYKHLDTSWDAAATDNDELVSLSYMLSGATSGNGTTLADVIFNKGVTTVTWTATDKSNNKSTCVFTVTVTDKEVPTFTTCVSNQTVNTIIGKITYTHVGESWDAIATDNDGLESLEYVLTGVTTGSGTTLDGVTFNLGVTTVTWTATDKSNNKSACVFTVTVTDKEVPTFTTCVSNQTVNTIIGKITYTHVGESWDAIATDNDALESLEYVLTGVTTGSGTTLDGVTFNKGVTSVTWTATDKSGNKQTCVFAVTVFDKEIPTFIQCVTNQAVDAVVGKTTYTHAGESWDASATDNDALESLEYVLTGVTTGNGTTLDGVTFNLGVTKVTWTATDISGNKQTCIFTVTVTDKEVPTFTKCVTNQSVNTVIGKVTYTHIGESWDAEVSDNNTLESLEYELTGVTTGSGTTLDGVTFNLGVTTVTWTATDNSGNKATCVFSVNVSDNEIPVFTKCMSGESISFSTESGSTTYTLVGITWDATATDNDGITTLTYVLTGATTGTGTTLDNKVLNVGVTTVTWTATDKSGNSSTCVFDITVLNGNSQPIAADDVVTTPEDTNATGNVLSNDSDPDEGNVLTVTGFKVGDETYLPGTTATLTSGTIVINSNGAFTYVPLLNYNGTVPSITYSISDGAEGTASANLNITVTPVNDAPLAADDLFQVKEGEELRANQLENDFDVETPKDQLSVRIVNAVPSGKFVMNSDGTFNFTSSVDFIGSIQFTYEICDKGNPALCDQATVTIEVVANEQCDFFVPNGFSPDGDGINDLFKVRCLYNYPDAKMSIFTRAGIKVFEKEHYGNVDYWQNDNDAWWNGSTENKWNVGGERLSAGTYIYILELNDSTKKIVKGTVFPQLVTPKYIKGRLRN